MGRFLNLGIIQMAVSQNHQENLEKIESMVEMLMQSFHKPEIIVGVEFGVSETTADTIPGAITDFLGSLAKKHGVYLIPGSLPERAEGLPDGSFHNTAPVFNPQGEMIAVYRKMCPWYPAEESVPGQEYVVFEIPEKDVTIGVQICYDIMFYELSRNLALQGAEVIINLAMDPDPLYLPYRTMPIARAVENQAYFIHTNGVGGGFGSSLYGHTMVVNPEAKILWEGGSAESACTVTLDLDLVRKARSKGTLHMHPLLNDLKEYSLPMPYSSQLKNAPVFQKLTPPACNKEEYLDKAARFGVGDLHKTK
ncbi:UNVERIFIED_CONTAM: putative amidohydrolase [Brevibacillus sp. OAP136]